MDGTDQKPERSQGNDMDHPDVPQSNSPESKEVSLQQAEKQRKKAKKKLQKLSAASEKRGILYISRIPPHMKPAKVKHLLSPYGEIGRLYLAPEDTSHRKARKQKGGNKGKEYTEGWVEFEDKVVAKEVAKMLNGQRMDPKRRSAFHEDLWSIKYLPKFKWHHLTEDIVYQNAIREQRMVFEISKAKRERDFYLKQVGQSKAINAMQERKRKRSEADGKDPGVYVWDDAVDNRKAREFRQRKAKPDGDDTPTISKATLDLIGGKPHKKTNKVT